MLRHRTQEDNKKYEIYIYRVEGLIWEDNFMKNCEDLKEYEYEWIGDVEEVVKGFGRKLPRKKFID